VARRPKVASKEKTCFFLLLLSQPPEFFNSDEKPQGDSFAVETGPNNTAGGVGATPLYLKHTLI